MKLPRDITGSELTSALKKYGYEVTRQKGSHIRLTRIAQGNEHHLTIPNHSPLKIGTLSGILEDVSKAIGKDKQAVISELFG